MNFRKKKGDHAEQLVCQHLLDNGFVIVARNYRKRYGEIDIIAKKNDLLVFVEVKRLMSGRWVEDRTEYYRIRGITPIAA